MRTARFLFVKKIVKSQFLDKITISKLRFKSVLAFVFFVGIAVGSYLTTANILIPYLYAAGDTYYSWDFASAGDYTASDANYIEISGGSAQLKVVEYQSDANTSLLLHFDESEGDPLDSSSNAHVIASGILGYDVENGKLNNAGDLDGKSNFVTYADDSSLSLGLNHTLEACQVPLLVHTVSEMF